MLISTMDDVPGHVVEEVIGDVFGLTVRCRSIGTLLGALKRVMTGGELPGVTKLVTQGRETARDRLTESAAGLGANAVLGFRFDTSDIGSVWTEVCAYGTAVRLRKLN